MFDQTMYFNRISSTQVLSLPIAFPVIQRLDSATYVLQASSPTDMHAIRVLQGNSRPLASQEAVLHARSLLTAQAAMRKLDYALIACLAENRSTVCAFHAQ